MDRCGRFAAGTPKSDRLLAYSLSQIQQLLLVKDWSALQPDQHESLAAFRVRFSEFQEHMGKTMKAVALEEEKPAEPFTAVLFYMEKPGACRAWGADQRKAAPARTVFA